MVYGSVFGEIEEIPGIIVIPVVRDYGVFGKMLAELSLGPKQGDGYLMPAPPVLVNAWVQHKFVGNVSWRRRCIDSRLLVDSLLIDYLCNGLLHPARCNQHDQKLT